MNLSRNRTFCRHNPDREDTSEINLREKRKITTILVGGKDEDETLQINTRYLIHSLNELYGILEDSDNIKKK